MRDPLTTTRNLARWLRQGPSASYGLEGATAIERVARRMTGWIDDVVDVACTHNGQDPPLVLAPADLIQLVRAAIDGYGSARRHRLLLDARVPCICGQLDAPRAERALDNLVGNAIKYSPGGGDVRLEVSARASAWRTQGTWSNNSAACFCREHLGRGQHIHSSPAA